MKVFGNKAIQYNVFEGKYTTTSLDNVSSALLGLSKYGNMNAGSENITNIPVEEQIKYVKRDAELVMLLAQYKNSLVLRLMKKFSSYAEMDYFKICNTDVGKWYENKYNKMISRGEITLKYTPEYKLEKQMFGGGHHTKPKKDFYISSDVYELDIKGMYPNIIIKDNISFDTLNCSCCEDDPNAQVDQNTIDLINEFLKEKKINRRVSKCWICNKRLGALPSVLQYVSSDREKYQRLLKGEKSKPNPNALLIDEYNLQQLAAKVFANVGYGLFGSEYFDFSNFKVAECITAEGRRIHKQMEIMAQQNPFNFEIVFGFTDSIFVRVDSTNSSKEDLIREFIERCKKELGMTVEIKNFFTNSIFYGEKNRLVGWSGKENDEPLIKGLDGLAYSDPLWVRKWVFKIISEIIKKPQSRFETVPKLLNEAVFDLKHNICTSEENIAKQLKFTQRLSMYPDKYHKGNRTGLLGRLLEKDKGEQVWWYEIIRIDAGTKSSFSTLVPKPENVNIKKYKEKLFDKLKDTLEITGFDVKKIKLEMVDGIRPLI
jgi:DNA polymerase elongation subunit (family B)